MKVYSDIAKGFIVVIFVLMIFFASKCNAQELGQWRWSNQKFMDAPYDNIQHLGTGFIPPILEWKLKKIKWWQADLIAIGAGVVWEIKDGFVPYEKFGKYGGEGFSWMDVRTDIYGVVLSRMINISIKKIYKKIKK